MLKITNEEHFHKVLKEIEDTDCKLEQEGVPLGLLEKLEDQFRWLHNYSDEHCDVRLGYDWAKWSFSVQWLYKGEHWLNGGLIFHNGAGMDDGTFSVELCPSRGPHWSVHT